MKTLSYLFFLFFICFQPANALANEINEKKLQSWMHDAGIPGISLSIIEEGKVRQKIAIGSRDLDSGDKVTHDTVFEAASLSKPVFAYIVARLVDKGELSFDTSLIELIDYERFENDDFAKKITPRLVLSHQSGLPNWGGTPLKFNFEPGLRFNYSGEGYVYLQKALEAKTGMTLQALAKQEVFIPLDMKNSAFSFAENHNFELSSAHSRLDVASPRNLPSDNAASSLHTTAEDYTKFILAFFSGNNLKQETRQTMMQTQVKMPVSWSNSADVELTDNLAWSLGWGVVTDAENPVYWHWGDNGDFRAFVAYDATRQDGLVYFANSANGLAISEAVYEAILPSAIPAVDWLGYAQFTGKGYKEARDGFVAEGQGEYSKALKNYQQSLALYPDSNMIQRKVDWFAKYIDKIENPNMLSAADAKPFIGKYGPRNVRFEDARLIYQREGNKAHKLVQISPNEFILPSVMNFKLEFVVGEQGIAEKLMGHYGDNGENGYDYSDESLRSD